MGPKWVARRLLEGGFGAPLLERLPPPELDGSSSGFKILQIPKSPIWSEHVSLSQVLFDPLLAVVSLCRASLVQRYYRDAFVLTIYYCMASVLLCFASVAAASCVRVWH